MQCNKCGTENTRALNFCSNCGARMQETTAGNYQATINKAQIFFFVLLAYILLLYLVDFDRNYVTNFMADGLLAGIVLVFFLLDFKNYWNVIKQPANKYLLYIILPLGLIVFAFIVTFITAEINRAVGVAESAYISSYWDAPYPLLFCIISVGVFPAIFEELAFRVILFNELSKIMNTNATIIITAILFTILHLSFISFFWILPAGLLFGYLRAKYKTPVYGMIGHFVYNISIVLIEYFMLGSGI